MIPDYRKECVGHYTFINTEVHGKGSYRMLCETDSFQRYSDMAVRLYNNMMRIKSEDG